MKYISFFHVQYDFRFADRDYSKVKYVVACYDTVIRLNDGTLQYEAPKFMGPSISDIYSNTAWLYLGPGAPTYTIQISGDYGTYDENDYIPNSEIVEKRSY